MSHLMGGVPSADTASHQMAGGRVMGDGAMGTGGGNGGRQGAAGRGVRQGGTQPTICGTGTLNLNGNANNGIRGAAGATVNVAGATVSVTRSDDGAMAEVDDGRRYDLRIS